MCRRRRVPVWFGIGLGTLLGCAALQAFTAPNYAKESNEIDWSKAETLTVRMEEYRFTPDHLTLRKGIPYRLHFVNAGKEIHEFTAPDFFKAAVLRDPEVLAPYGNEVVVQPNEEKDAFVFLENAGLFAPICADHDWAGMKATIIVE